MSTPRFYAKLKIHNGSIASLLREENFEAIPDDWHVVIADIRNSTAAVAAGTHNDVNLVAAGSLVAGLNVARKHGVEIPFFFGGDGGNLLVPDSILGEVLAALRVHRQNSQQSFGLDMHIGSVPMTEVRAAGHIIRLAKTRLGKSLPKAVLVGDGLLWAERQVKQGGPKDPATLADALDMMGLECRWDRIKPPHAKAEIVCYLIEACQPGQQVDLYREVLLKADEIFGEHEVRNPLSMQRLQLLVTVKKMRNEMLARFGRWRRRYLVSELLKTALGRLVFRFNLKVADLKGKEYLEEVISNADTLTLDGRINTIISGTSAQRLVFLEYLRGLEARGLLRYGHHINGESVMTCYIEARQEKHIHFVDGGDGGYSAAAGELKKKDCVPVQE